MGNIGLSKKGEALREYAAEYEGKLTSRGGTETWAGVFLDKLAIHAGELGCDSELLDLDGEFLGFDTEEEYRAHQKNVSCHYAGVQFFFARWK